MLLARLKITKPLHKNLGQPQSARAVGMRLSKNPILILIPCHRVVYKNGSMTGFAAGLQRKQWLLAHERQNPLFTRVL
ncbi:MAG: MGMT family protein [Planctomycetota bacterium]|nr:MAG: MGMT family protein [Planctomycetota bacterium]